MKQEKHAWIDLTALLLLGRYIQLLRGGIPVASPMTQQVKNPHVLQEHQETRI